MINETLSLLILEHLEKAQRNPLREDTLFAELRRMVHPVATQEDWDHTIIDLLQKDFVAFTPDFRTKKRKFYIKDLGIAALGSA